MSLFYSSVMPSYTIVITSHKTLDNTCIFSIANGVKKSFITKNFVRNHNLQSFDFSRSVDGIGSFSFTFAENIHDVSIIDKIVPLDIVKIYDGYSFQFDGIITSVAVGTIADSTRTISVNGKSSEYLFDMLNISVDNSAMTFFLGEAQDIKTTVEICKVSKNGEDDVRSALDRDNLIKILWKNFCGTVNNDKYEYIASSNISKLIMYLYRAYQGANFKNLIGSCQFWNSKYNFDIKYPVSSQLFKNSNVKFIDYLRNILPTPIYEIFNVRLPSMSVPQIIIREVPFDKKSWKDLKSFEILPYQIVNYNLRRSIDEVYTAFFPYLQGSIVSPEFYKNLSASVSGSSAAAKNKEKISYYGYKPLTCNFVGFAKPKTETEKNAMNNSVSESFKQLAEKMEEMFGHNDEMYSGDITVVEKANNPYGIGVRLKFGGMQFYVTSEKVQWRYGQVITHNYTLTRGGIYDKDGNFSPLKDFNEFLKSVEK